jgi:large subunit ribosomal protein L32
MAVPKRRTSKSKQGHRRSHHRVTAKGIQYCVKCNEPVLPHRICAACGNYQGREALVVKTDDNEGK